MGRRLATSSRWTWTAAGLCLIAGVVFAWQLWRGDQEVPPASAPAVITPAEAPSDSADAEADPGATGLEIGSAEDYAEITERPLFNRTRRPSASDDAGEGGAAGGEDSPAANISLNGVLLTGTRHVALLRFDNDPKVMHVGEGEEAAGWLVETIRPDRVVLRRGDVSSEVVLDYKRKAEPRAGGASSRRGAPPRQARPNGPTPPTTANGEPAGDPDEEPSE
jgi:hypothetical protein